MIAGFQALKYCIDTGGDCHGIAKKLDMLSKTHSYVKRCKEVEEANKKYALEHKPDTVTASKEKDNSYPVVECRSKQHLNKCAKVFMPR